MKLKTTLFLLATACTYFIGSAQTLDKKFMTTDGPVYVTLQNGDSVYIGGSFSGVGYNYYKLARYKPGILTPDSNFPQLGYYDNITAIESDENGGFYIAGSISTYNGVPVNTSVLHILSNGKRDENFASVILYGSNIRCLKYKGNRLYVGGSSYIVYNTSELVVLNATTGVQENWKTLSFNGSVEKIEATDSLVFVTGYFDQLNNTSLPCGFAALSAISGNLIDNFPLTDGSTTALAIDSNLLYIGGKFSNLGYAKQGVAQVTTNGLKLNLKFPSTDGSVFCVLPDTKGGFYLGGHFNNVNNLQRTNLVHILPNGTIDVSFYVNMDGEVYSLSTDSTSLFIGGSFTTVNGITRNNAAAVMKNTGSLTTFNPATNGPVYTIVNKNNVVYMGGAFTTVKGLTRNYAAACSKTNSIIPWSPNADGNVNCIIINDAGTTAFLGGAFTKIKGKSMPYLAKTDLINGTPYEWNPLPNNQVNSMVMNGNALYVKGSFSIIKGVFKLQLAAIDTTSAMLTSFSADMPDDNSFSGFNRNQLCIDSGKLYITGNFSTIQGVLRKNVARIDLATGIVDRWNLHETISTNNNIYTVATSGAKLVYGGDFNFLYTMQRRNFAIINISDVNYTPTNWQAKFLDVSIERINDILPYKNDVFIGGVFQYDTSTSGNWSGVYMSNLIVLNDSTGTLSHNFNYKPNGDIESLCINNNRLMVTGSFSSFNRLNDYSAVEPRYYVASYDLLNYKLTSAKYNPNKTTQLISDKAGNLILAGSFSLLSYSQHTGFACLNIQTGKVTPWNPLIYSGTIYAMAIKDSTIFIGGNFSYVNNEYHNNIAALSIKTGSLVSGWNVQIGYGQIDALAIKDETLYFGGNFYTVNNTARQYAAAVSTNKGTLKAWNPNPNNPVLTILTSGNYVYLGGAFTYLNSNNRQYLAKVSAVSGNATAWAPAPDNSVYKIISADNNIYISGGFTNIFGKNRNAIAILDSATGRLKAFDAKINYYSTVSTIAADANNLFIGGGYNFYSIGDSSRGYLAGINIASNQALPFNPRPDNYFTSSNGLSIGKGKLFVGGNWNYLGDYSSPPNFAVYTLQPQQQTSNLNFSNIQTSSATITFTKGDGEKRLVVMRDAATPLPPIDGKSYTANPVFKSGGATGTSSFVVFDDDSIGVGVSNLLPGHTYTVSVYEHNGTSTASDYFTDSVLTGSFTTPLTAANKTSNAVKASLITAAKVYPNPATDYCNVKFEAKNEALFSISLTDEKGVAVQSTSFNAIKGGNTFHMNVSAIAAGTYIIVIKDSDGKSETLKFIKN